MAEHIALCRTGDGGATASAIAIANRSEQPFLLIGRHTGTTVDDVDVHVLATLASHGVNENALSAN